MDNIQNHSNIGDDKVNLGWYWYESFDKDYFNLDKDYCNSDKKSADEKKKKKCIYNKKVHSLLWGQLF